MRVLHCADIHLGYETHGRLDPETGLNTRLLDFKKCFDFMVERALEEEIDLFLFCGDAYRTADPTPTQQRLFAEALKPIGEAGIPIRMVIGNHDHPVSYGKASSVDIFRFLSGDVEVLRRPTLCADADGAHRPAIRTKSGPLQLMALPWPVRSLLLSRSEHRAKTPHEIREYVEGLYAAFVRQHAALLDPDVPAILAGHFSVTGSDLGGSERTSLIAHEPKFSPGDLAVPPLDYVALGHIHKYQDRNPEGTIPVVYSSSIERISFKEHDADKGFVLIDIDPDKPHGERTAYRFVPTPARPFIPITVDAREAADPTAAILKAIGAHDLTDAVVRVRYEVTEDQLGALDTDALREALKAADTIAAVERTVDPGERQRRTVVRAETGLEEAMRRYIAQHDHLGAVADDLVEAALEIEREIEETT